MIPVIAIIGRPNVGKSTLFNCVTKTRDAIVADSPGLTRDRQYGYASYQNRAFVIVDTGGLGEEQTAIDKRMHAQVQVAIEEADVIWFVADAKDGLTPVDEVLAKKLRARNKSVFLVINKTDGLDEDIALADFYRLGFSSVIAIAAAQNSGINDLLAQSADLFPNAEASADVMRDQGIKVAVVGKPNVGKSTLINSILGEERLMVFDEPGTTRDSIFVPFDYRGQRYTLIDTAGVRRRHSIVDKIEKFSVVKTLQAIELSNVVLFLIDAKENISEQDLKLLGLVLNSGKALVVVVNKWDAVSNNEKEWIERELDRRLTFLDYAQWHFISAKQKRGVKSLFRSIIQAHHSAIKELKTPLLNRILEKAVAQHQPPLVGGRRVKLRYAHAGGKNPPIIVIHGNQVEQLPSAYKRYLSNFYRKALRLVGTPIRIELRNSENPYH
ncbi:MAG: ribosome biogenesis GTPase Der [Gammaproteobacteria bacterium RIFCSPHIGHO2_02_FULL_42_13]|nr:MAG: ribosome biogenesis GTPase Der [Gammaproteobacteria bacterium RIFCSPHIGHO2_02_FULL_42_13]OGT70207.1 MAG: ribosome biogenesis GTPase Der [Gammaproteobacteria bacterium RIFCSPLOWO2_02_FULL_42_9]